MESSRSAWVLQQDPVSKKQNPDNKTNTFPSVPVFLMRQKAVTNGKSSHRIPLYLCLCSFKCGSAGGISPRMASRHGIYSSALEAGCPQICFDQWALSTIHGRGLQRVCPSLLMAVTLPRPASAKWEPHKGRAQPWQPSRVKPRNASKITLEHPLQRAI